MGRSGCWRAPPRRALGQLLDVAEVSVGHPSSSGADPMRGSLCLGLTSLLASGNEDTALSADL